MVHTRFRRPFVKRFALCYQTVVCPVLSVCDVGVLWPNGWMDQDEIGMRVGLGSGHIVLDGDPAPPIFGPYLLWPNGRMHQDATWHGGRTRRSDNVLHEDAALLEKKIQQSRVQRNLASFQE